MEKNLAISNKTMHVLIFNSKIPLLGIYLEDTLPKIQKYMCSIIVIAKYWKLRKCAYIGNTGLMSYETYTQQSTMNVYKI